MDENQTEGVEQASDVSEQESVTPAEKAQPESPPEGTGESQEVAEQPREEEAELSEEERQHLSERTQARIRQLIEERNKARDEKERIAQEMQQTIKPTGVPGRGIRGLERKAPGRDFTLERAREKLKEAGFITEDDFRAFQDSLILDKEYDRLESKYSGKDGRPKFDRVEVEDYMKRSGNYNPEDAYKSLYYEELVDAAKKEAVKQSRGTPTESPSASVPPEARARKGSLSRDDIAKMTPAEYEEYREKILRLMSEQQL